MLVSQKTKNELTPICEMNVIGTNRQIYDCAMHIGFAWRTTCFLMMKHVIIICLQLNCCFHNNDEDQSTDRDASYN